MVVVTGGRVVVGAVVGASVVVVGAVVSGGRVRVNCEIVVETRSGCSCGTCWKSGAVGPVLFDTCGVDGGVRPKIPLMNRIPANSTTAATPMPASTIVR